MLRLRLTILCSLLYAAPAWTDDTSASGDDPGGTASTATSENEPPESEPLIYSVNRLPERPFDVSRAVRIITSDEIWRRNARNLPELLMEEAGVFVQQTNYGGGSPILRGLMGKQILIMIDGVRLNNATYRFGPLQYLNTVDVNMVERIEIVRGVGSVVGSDALGGIINIVPKKGPTGTGSERFTSSLFTRYSSGDNAMTGYAQSQGRSDKQRFHAGVSFRNTGDVTAGGGELQEPTGYGEKSANLSYEYYFTTDKTLSIRYHGLDQNNVPRSDRIVSGRNELFEFDPQRLQLVQVSFQDLAPAFWDDFWQLTAYWNRQEEGRREIRTSAPETERYLDDRQSVFGLMWELGSYVGETHRLVYGLDLSTESVHSERVDTNLETGATRRRRGRYTDESSYSSLAIYLQDRMDLGDRVTMTLGLRNSHFYPDGVEESPVGSLNLDSHVSGLTGSAGVVFHLNKNVNLVGNFVRGFRAPNIDDISIFNERSDGTEVPNTDLSAERIVSYEAGAKFSTTRFSSDIFYHWGSLNGLLVRAGGTVNGLAFFDLDGDGRQGVDEPNVLMKRNLGESSVHGFELSATYRLPGFRVFGNVTRTTGTDELTGDPLRRIPPTFGTLGVGWSARSPRQPWAEFRLHFAGAQTRLSPDDIGDERIGPDGTPGFEVFHIRSGFSASDRFRITASIENVFDERFKYHASGILRPGRQLVLGVELTY